MRLWRNERQISKFARPLINGCPSPRRLCLTSRFTTQRKVVGSRRLCFPRPPQAPRPLRGHTSPAPPAPLLSSILHYPTDDLSDRRPPPASSCCQPSVRIKPAILFIFILLPFPSSVFFLKIVCQHCLLGCTQWNRQCLLN